MKPDERTEIATDQIVDYVNPTYCSLQSLFDFDNSSLYIGYQSASKLIKNISVIKPLYIIKYVISGKGYLKIGGRTYRVTAGDVFMLPKNVLISYYSDPDDPFAYYYIGVDGMNIEKTLARCGLSEDTPVRRYQSPEVGKAFERICMKLKTYAFTDNLAAISDFYGLLSVMSEYDRDNTVALRRNDVNYVNYAIHYIKENYAYNVSVSEIAERLGIGRSYFSALFRRETGASPQEYLLRFRISQACKLIALGMSVTEAGSHCGFNSPTNFSVQFKKFMLVTPREYLVRSRERDKEEASVAAPPPPNKDDLRFFRKPDGDFNG